MSFGLHFMSHLTAVHNSFIFYVHVYAGDMTVDETLSASASA